MKRRMGSTRTKDLALRPGGMTTRQMTTLVLALVVAIVLLPLGAQAAQMVSAVITDPDGTNQAEVDPAGNLHTTSMDDPARKVFQAEVPLSTNVSGDIEFVDVPAGHRLVIAHVSGSARVPTGQSVSINLLVDAGGHADHVIVPTLNRSDEFGDQFFFSQDTMIYADGQFSVEFFRSPPSPGQAFASVSVSGYLIDCTAAPCN